MSDKKIVKKETTIVRNEVKTWICQETGEVVEGVSIYKPINRNGFMITYITEIINLLDTLGTKKMKIVKYLLQEMEKSNNTILTTTRKLADKTNTSPTTVTETLKLLEDSQIIQRTTGAIMINPKLIHKGTNEKEKMLMTRFYSFDSETP